MVWRNQKPNEERNQRVKVIRLLYYYYIQMILFIFVLPIILLLTLLLAGVVDEMLLDWAFSDCLKAWAKHWLDGKKPKEN